MSIHEEWEAEQSFWAAPNRPKTWDLESVGRPWAEYQTMVEQEDPYGDWVRAEHYRRDVEALEKKIAELQDRLTPYFPHCESE
jgi:hypothetical protein